MKKLNARQIHFVEEYVRNGGNAARAAIAAGYSQRSAYSIGQENLTKPEIAQAVEQRRAALRQQYQATSERVIEELSALAFTHIGQVTDFDASGLTVRPFSELSPAELAAVVEISETPSQFGTKRTVRMHSKIQALKLLGDSFGLFDLSTIIDRMTPAQLESLAQTILSRLTPSTDESAPASPR